jgi:hypothetical protein
MKTTRKLRNSIEINGMFILALTFLVFASLAACNKEESTSPQPTQKATINGTVKDQLGNPYPSTLITVTKGSDKIEKATNPDGFFSITTNDIGTYSIAVELPLSTKAIGNFPSTVQVQANETKTIDFVIQPEAVESHVNFGSVQLIEEIKDVNGNTPVDPNEPLYSENIFDPPLGLLTAIETPANVPVTLSAFTGASGSMLVHCDGTSSTVEITLTGMIPNGTYSFWLAYLNKTKHVGEQIDFANDFVFPNNPPLGSGSTNVVIAESDGTLHATIPHASCILTDQVALVIPVIYHLHGNTYGSGHIPDAEETVHMLTYFQ